MGVARRCTGRALLLFVMIIMINDHHHDHHNHHDPQNKPGGSHSGAWRQRSAQAGDVQGTISPLLQSLPGHDDDARS